MHAGCRTCRCEPEFFGKAVCPGCDLEFTRGAKDQKFCTQGCKLATRHAEWRRSREAKGYAWHPGGPVV